MHGEVQCIWGGITTFRWAWPSPWCPVGSIRSFPRWIPSCWLVRHMLLGGWPTPLKNDGVGQLRLLFPIYGKNNPAMFQSPPTSVSLPIFEHYKYISHVRCTQPAFHRLHPWREWVSVAMASWEIPQLNRCFAGKQIIYLVGGFKPSEKYESQWEGLSNIVWKIINVPNHQSAITIFVAN